MDLRISIAVAFRRGNPEKKESGQHIAVSGTVLGYYLFKRLESNKSETVDPWEADLIRIQR